MLGFQAALSRRVVKNFAVTKCSLSHQHMEHIGPVRLFKPTRLERLFCVTEIASTCWCLCRAALGTKHLIQCREEAFPLQRSHNVWRYGRDKLLIRVVLDHFRKFLRCKLKPHCIRKRRVVVILGNQVYKVVVSLSRVQSPEPLLDEEQRDSRGVSCPILGTGQPSLGTKLEQSLECRIRFSRGDYRASQ